MQELENLNLKDDEFDFMKYLDEELVGEVAPENNPSPGSSTSLINIESTDSSSFCPSSTPVLINFENPNSIQSYADAPKNMKVTTARMRPPSQTTYDHIVAERRRREQINNHFVALSTIVPGLKKVNIYSLCPNFVC